MDENLLPGFVHHPPPALDDYDVEPEGPTRRRITTVAVIVVIDSRGRSSCSYS
jgi:hypothetical protein